MSKNFRNRKRKHNKKLPARYTLLIMTAVCFVTMLLSLTLNISGGPLKTAAGYVFIPMQKGINSFGIHISDKVTEIRTPNDSEKNPAKRTSQRHKGDRGVGACDEEENGVVIHYPEEFFGFWIGDSVIKG